MFPILVQLIIPSFELVMVLIELHPIIFRLFLVL